MTDLRFDRVSKKYRIRQGAYADHSRQAAIGKLLRVRGRSEEFWALRDVSFEVKRGEALGIIGPNGAGKSTILKLLSSITTPTVGEITIAGSLSALIEVGSGFHPELTGRENIYLSGLILGMRRRQISQKLDSIVDFAGVSQFIDTPVKRYSSGMYVRLGFSVAAHLEADILLLDEVLAVGDAAFQAKCHKRIDDLKEEGRTIVFISHDLGSVEKICDRALLLERGEITAGGSPQDVIKAYLNGPATSADAHAAGRSGRQVPAAEITSVSFHEAGRGEPPGLRTGHPAAIRVAYTCVEPVADVTLSVFFFSHDNRLHCQLTTENAGRHIDLEPGSRTIEFHCDELGLLPGDYYVGAAIKRRHAPIGDHIDWKPCHATIRVGAGKNARGRFHMGHSWRFIDQEDAGDERAGVSAKELASQA
jgi:ABC-type polysaccharide/polyol phosphate transport system ATPase subunit